MIETTPYTHRNHQGVELPELPLESWKDTLATLHIWSQMMGKIRLKLVPLTNHWWNVTFYANSRGLTTGVMPCNNKGLEMQLDFVSHELVFKTSDGERRSIELGPQSVAEFYSKVKKTLAGLGCQVDIWPVPVEIPDAIPFEQDFEHASYDPEAVTKFWTILSWADDVFKEFRTRFVGKCSPVHFFWGSFDHTVTRFSGRLAPARPGADRITREAYSHEVSSAGFWPGGGSIKGPAFYAYAAPEPKGFAEYPINPPEAFYSHEAKEFILLYEDVLKSDDPRGAVLDFLQTTYEAAANKARWNRRALER